MKRILYLLIAVFITSVTYGQKEVIDTLFESSGAIDTVVYRIMKKDAVYFTLDVGTLADNDSIDVAYATMHHDLCSFNTSFPMKLTKSYYKKVVNGVLMPYRIGFDIVPLKAKYMAIRIKSAGACSPSIRFNP